MAQQKRFSFADLAPEPLEFEGKDGTIYTARRLDDFGILEAAELQRIQRRLQVAHLKLDSDDEDKAAEAAAAFAQQLDAFVRLVAPTLPDAALADYPSTWKIQFMSWWKDEHPQLTDPKATAGMPTAPAAQTPPTSSPGWPRPSFKANRAPSSRRRRT